MIDPQTAILTAIGVIVLVVVILATDRTPQQTYERPEKMRLNRWDIAWGVAYGLVIAVPLLAAMLYLAFAMLGVALVG